MDEKILCKCDKWWGKGGRDGQKLKRPGHENASHRKAYNQSAACAEIRAW